MAKKKDPNPPARDDGAGAPSSEDLLDESEETLVAGAGGPTDGGAAGRTAGPDDGAEAPEPARPEIVRVDYDAPEPGDGAAEDGSETGDGEHDLADGEEGGLADDEEGGLTDGEEDGGAVEDEGVAATGGEDLFSDDEGRAEDGDGDAEAGGDDPEEGHAGEVSDEVPAPTGGDDRVKQLSDKVSKLTDALSEMEGDRESLRSVSEQFSSMQENLKSLQHLSELLSLRYNPFLEEEEAAIFDGDRNDPQSMIRRMEEGGKKGDAGKKQGALSATELQEGPAGPPAAAHRNAAGEDAKDDASDDPETTREVDLGGGRSALAPTGPGRGDQAEGGGAAAGATDAATDETRGPRQRPPPRPRPMHEEATRLAPTSAVGAAPEEGRELYVGPSRTASFGVRETFLVMTWFEHLIGKKDPAVLYVYLDYYHEIGWLSSEAHGWMVQLARGVGQRQEGADWAGFGLKPTDLMKTHMASLRFFDFLFRINLDRSEERDLQKKLGDILGDR